MTPSTSGMGGPNPFQQQPPGRAAPKVEKPKTSEVFTAEAFEQKALAYEKQAKEEEAKLDTSKPNLAIELGAALMKQSENYSDRAAHVAAIQRDWDPNRDGNIVKMEFRTSVRKLVPAADAKDCDDVFEVLDLNKSGELDMNELKLALKKLIDDYRRFGGGKANIQAKADRCRELAAEARRIGALTAEWESSVKVEEDMLRRSVGANLGAFLKKKGLKANELASKWGGKDGLVDKAEFRKEVSALGIQAEVWQIDGLFGQLDEDGGGTLDATELGRALKKLTEESDRLKAEMAELKLARNEAMAKAKAAQDAWKSARHEEEVAAAELAQKEAQAQQARAAAAAEAKAARAAEAAAKKAKAAEEKAAFEAKIAAKRGKGDKGGGESSPSEVKA